MSSTTSASTSAAPSTPANPRNRVVLASLIGTTIEFYDFYVYATAAVLVFPHLFFPAGDPTTALLQSFAIFGAAMVARPVGAVIFGHLGDKHGRKATLVGALLTMGVATFLIGLLPTYLMVGWFAPLLLVILRIAQGFALGGEWSGAALVATENAPEGKRAWYGTFPQLGAPIGFIIANGLFLIIAAVLPSDDPSSSLPSAAFLDWGWRIPFLFSVVMVIVGLWVRLRLVESAAFTNASNEGKLQKLPLASVFRNYWKQLILGTFFMLATYVLFYLMTTFSLGYGTKPTDVPVPGLGYSYTTFVLMLIGGVVFFGIFTLLSGPWADRWGRRKTLIWVTLGIIVFGLLWVPFLSTGFPGVMAWLIVGFALMGMTFGPMGALLPELFPTNVRYTGSGISYNVSSILGAAVAPFIGTALWAAGGGSPFWVGIYLSVMAVLTLIALIVSKETKDVDYESAGLESSAVL
ncbi:MHS family MFS transporter [Agromyces sp. ISL-38]|uniref:MFS transporter n=1 Tax=Agromyces sp. ISL-38 TaxID=2819107 RepID=UPI001BE77C42|nr:MFS transporter [Agromyces sp. ISL-38]MBT2500373.1 MHS family MFS transporter [Agromyces sp. ISL-38]